jgi:hypothetical protein
MMSQRLGRRALRSLARDLADSDPRLDDLFFSFNQRACGGKMPRTEKIKTWPNRLLARIGCRVRPTSTDLNRLSAWWL